MDDSRNGPDWTIVGIFVTFLLTTCFVAFSLAALNVGTDVKPPCCPPLPDPRQVELAWQLDVEKRDIAANEEAKARLQKEVAEAQENQRRQDQDPSKVAVASLFSGNRRDTQYVECLAGRAVVQPQGASVPAAEMGARLPTLLRGATHVTFLVRSAGGFETFNAARAALHKALPDLPLGYLPVREGWKLSYSDSHD